MNGEKQSKDQRRHVRFLLNDKVFLTFRPHFDRIGPIVDISKGGVSLEYAVIQDYSKLTDRLNVDIFSSSKTFEMFNVPCRLVYDWPVKQNKGFLETIETRRCGLEFIELTQQQADQIETAMVKSNQPVH